MNRLLFVAKNNIKKQKGDMITFFILTLIAAFLIFDCVSALTGLGRVMDDKFREVNGAHVMIYNFGETESLAAEKAFKEDPHIVAFEQTPAIRFITDYKNKKSSEYLQYMFYAESYDREKSIMKVAVPEGAHAVNDIFLPYNLKSSFAIGDTIQIRFDDDIYEFNVAGFLEDPYFCSTMNITVYCVAMSPEMIEELTDKYPGVIQEYCLNKGRMAENYEEYGYSTDDLEKDIADRYKKILSDYAKEGKQVNMSNFLGVNWEMMRGGSQFLPQIVMAVMLVFAVLILIIAMVIISVSVSNFIRKNMKNTGILEACGYTVWELRLALVMQISLVALAGAATGITAASLTFGRFGNVISSILGLSWNQPVNLKAAAVILAAMTLSVGLTALNVSGAYKRISVLDALRGGITTHNFRKNHFALEDTPLPLPLALAMKDTFREPGRNIVMVLVSMLLVASTVIGFGMNENFGGNPDSLVDLMAFEIGTAQVDCGGENVDISEDLRKTDGVANVLAQTGFEPVLKYGDKKDMFFTFAVDDMKNTRHTSMVEGRMPETDNEIMVSTGVSKDMGVKIGDVVTLEYAEKEADYIIVGINQRLERMGRTIYMNTEAAKKIYPGDIAPVYQYIVTAEEGVTYDQLKAKLDKYAEDAGLELHCQDLALSMEGTMGSVTTGMKLMCMAISLITILIVVFVESLVIRAKISHEWRGMGISKALGQTSGGLLKQIMLSNMPAIATGAVLGALIATPAGSAAVRAAFSLFVIRNISFTISPVWMILSVTGIVLVALLTSAAAGLKVRQLKPAEMICEE